MPHASEPRIDSVAELERWLEEHHTGEGPVWLTLAKKHVVDRYVPHDALVRTLLAFGWVDSQKRRVDDDTHQLRVSPRRRGSPWSAVNKRHISELEAQGRLRPAGAALVAQARADGSWAWLDDIEALVEPDDLRGALDADPRARTVWDAFPPSARKAGLRAVKSARRADTRARRVARIVADAASGRRPA